MKSTEHLEIHLHYLMVRADLEPEEGEKSSSKVLVEEELLELTTMMSLRSCSSVTWVVLGELQMMKVGQVVGHEEEKQKREEREREVQAETVPHDAWVQEEEGMGRQLRLQQRMMSRRKMRKRKMMGRRMVAWGAVDLQ